MGKCRDTTILVLLCLAVIIKDTSSEMFHIVTSASSPCPGRVFGQPCLTLQQYASNPSHGSNITLQLEGGTHNFLDSTLKVSSIASFEMLAFQGATIRCRSTFSSYISINSVQEVRISGVSFANCSTSVNNANHFILEDSFVFESTVRTRRVQHAAVKRTSFSIHGQYSMALFDKTEALLENCTFFDSAIYGRPGGSIWVSDSNITVSQSSFTNISGISGALYVEGRRNTVTIENSNFEGNSLESSSFFSSGFSGIVAVSGISLAITGSNFTNNQVSGNGGVILGNSVDLSINSSNFIHNKAGSNGGVVDVESSTDTYYAPSLSSIFIDNSNFINNVANLSGGALYASVEMVSIHQSVFTGNRALLGGGGVLYSGRHSTKVSLVESTFINNSAAYCGVMEVDEQHNYTVTFINSVFNANKAIGQATGRREGGVLCARNASAFFLNSSFSYNTAAGDAGVGYVEESTVTIQESTFDNNVAGGDGGVFKNHIYATLYAVSQSSFTHNLAGEDGGVWYIGRAGSQASVSASTFGFNRATGRGGIATVLGSQLDFTDTDLFNNTAYWGSLFSSCNSQISTTNRSLFIYADPIQPLCSLYYNSNTTIPQEDNRQANVTTIAATGIPTTDSASTISNSSSPAIPTSTTYKTRTDSIDSNTTPNPQDENGQTNKESTTSSESYTTTTQMSGANTDSNVEANKAVDPEVYHSLTIVAFIISITLLMFVGLLYIALILMYKLMTKRLLNNSNCKSKDLTESESETTQMESLLTSDKGTNP